MLGKLLKHEFRATGRIMLPLIGAELLLSVLAGFSVRGLDRIQNMNFLGVTYIMTLFVFFLGLFAVGVVALVLMIQRFYRNLLRDEGYLAMTLPVSVDEHIWSKLIVSFVWFAAV
ncbi:MAG: ABC transporter permease, partial [Ruminococcus sp.]|nr:ABC transporter permease [Ruminococcus sp.]